MSLPGWFVRVAATLGVGAAVRRGASVRCPQMPVHIAVRGERHLTVLAFERPFPGVHQHMSVEGTCRAQHLIAHAAAIVILAATVCAARRIMAA